MASSKFSAVDAALGYVYQIRFALLHSLRHAKNSDDFSVGLETLDDVAFVTSGGTPYELLQTKHHLNGKSTLSDAGVDLWKTIRVWVEGRKAGDIPPTATLYLLTTSIATGGTAASNLRVDPRNVDAAVSALNVTASSSSNKENEDAYECYLALTQAERKALLSQAYVVDAAPNIIDLDAELRREVRWSAEKQHVEAFLERLEGWWLRRVLRQLTKTEPLIDASEIEAQMSDLREQFQRDFLPIDDDILAIELNDTLIGSFTGKTFIRQIELVTANSKRIGSAIRDYFRAYEQRSRWVRQDLMLDVELHKYERQLTEEWEIVYEQLRDEVGDAATEDAMTKAGLSLLSWAENTLLPVRKNVTAPFVCRGSLHMLADESRVGWHPQFRDRLAVALKVEEVA